MDFLKIDGDTTYLLPYNLQNQLHRTVVANHKSWSNITELPDYLFDVFTKQMRTECNVVNERFTFPPETGPKVIIEESGFTKTIRIDSDHSMRGALHYRNCFAVMAYFAGIHGKKIKPVCERGVYKFTDEQLILLGISTRYAMMPPKYIKKIYLLTQMSLHDDNAKNDKSFLRSFVDNLSFQAEVPEWVAVSRLQEHAIASNEFADVISRRSVEDLVERYRKHEHYRDPLV